jgi:hypothetical protein
LEKAGMVPKEAVQGNREQLGASENRAQFKSRGARVTGRCHGCVSRV